MQQQQWVISDSPAPPPVSKEHKEKPTHAPKTPGAPAANAAPQWVISNSPIHVGSTASEPPPNVPDLHDLTANPKKEGLYRMKGAAGRVYGVPFSRVEEANVEHHLEFEPDEETRFDKDEKDANPGVVRRFQKRGEKWLESNLGPNAPRDNRTAQQLGLPANATTEEIAAAQRKNPVRGEWIGGTVNGIGYGVGEVALHPADTLKGVVRQVYDFANSPLPIPGVIDEHGVPVEPHQRESFERTNKMLHDTYRGFKEDPAFTAGTFIGQGEVLKALHGAGGKVIGKTVDVAKKVPEAVGKFATGTGASSAAQMVDDANAYNEDVLPEKQKAVRAENDKIVGKATTKAEKAHAEKVQAVRDRNTKKVQKHVGDVLEATTHNAEVLRKARAEHEAEVARVRAENEAGEAADNAHQKASEEAHQQKVEEVDRLNKDEEARHARELEEQAELERKRKSVRRRDLLQRGNVYRRVKNFEARAKAYFNDQYAQLSEATKGYTLPISRLVDGVYNATQHIEGSRTAIPIFKDIIDRAQGMGPDGKVAKPKLSMRDVEGYDDLAPDEQEVIRRGGVTGEGQSISYKDLQGYDRELGKIIGSPSTMADVRQAAISAQEIVREMKQEIAEQVGPETAQRNAELAGKYRAFAETFFDHAGPSGSGSLVAQAAKAEEAYHGSKPFRGLEPEEVERLRSMVTMLGDHTDLPLQSKKLLASIERLWKIDSEAQELPPPRDPKPPKVTPPPEFKLLPKPPKPFTPKPVPEFEPPTSESRRLKKVPEPLTDADLEPEPKYVPPNKEDLNLKPEPEPSTVTPEQARARKKENLRKFVSGLENSRLSKSGFGALTAGGAVLVARSLLGHADLVTTGMEAVAGTGIAVMGLMGKQLTAKLLRSEAVVNALTRLTKADMDALAKLKPVDRAAALDTLSVLSREAKRIGAIPKNTPTPWVNVAKHERKTPGSLFSEGENVVESADPERGVREVKLPVEQEDQQPQEPPTPTPQEPVETPESARGLDAEEDESGEGPTLDKAGRPVVDAASIQPGASGRVLTKDLHVDPKRFQYKLNSSAEGVTNQLQGKKWNEDLAGVIQVWRDPKDGELYVVNGHHRVELANRLGADSLQVRAIDAPDVESARRVGALQNIAEGRGTAIDAAKFFRDGGYAPEDLVREGVSLGEATATNGLALSQLSDSLFDEVAQGKMPMNRGIAIGKATADPVAQQATMDLVEKAEARGRHMSDAAVAELARFTADAEENTRTEVDLFGNYTVTESLAVEKAEVSAYIKKKLRERKQTFGAVASKTKAETLASAGNKIEAAENKRISEDAAQAIELYNKLSIGKGPINDALVEAARAINDRAKPEVAKQRAYETVVQKLNEALPRTTGR